MRNVNIYSFVALPVSVAQFVQAAIGYGNTSVTTKRLQSFCRRNHLLSPGNFSLFGEHSDLSPRNLLLVHGHRLNANTHINRLFLVLLLEKGVGGGGGQLKY